MVSPKARKAGSNAWVAEQLRELAVRLELEGDPHRPRAYRRAADSIEQLDRPISALRTDGGRRGLEGLRGVGPHIARIVCELVDTRQIGRLEGLRRKTPVDVMALLAVDGIGPKTLKVLWEKLRVQTVKDLERALREERLRDLPGFGQRREDRLREAVRVGQRGPRRMPLGEAAAMAQELRDALARHPRVGRCAVAGSIRRGRETVGDIDLVAAADDSEAVAQVLLERPEVEYVYSRGPRRVSVRLKSGVDVDLRIVAPECYGSALLYFTGSRTHTVGLRRLALAQGFRLNEYGLFRGSQRVAGKTEEEVYAALSLPFLPPESRQGEASIRDALRRGKSAEASQKQRP